MKTSMLIHPDEISKKWIDKLANAGVGVLGIHPVGGKRAAAALSDLVDTAKTPRFRSLIDYAKSLGLEIEYEVHAAGYLMPRELFATHPEYFRVNKEGQRSADWNFCVSNPSALELFAKRAAKLASDLYGSSKNYYFWMDDGRGFKCHCPKCRELSASDQQLIAVNAMLSEIKKTEPNAKMAYLAYMDSITVPSRVSAEKGVFLEYAPFEKYTAKGDGAAERIAIERKMIVPLMEFFHGEPCKVLEYFYDNSMFSGWKKPPAKFTLDEAKMRNEIKDYIELGFEYMSTFACFLGEDYESLYGDVSIIPFAKAVL